MATHKSAIKRHRQSLKRRSRNRHIRVGMGTLVKRFRNAIDSGDAEAAAASYPAAERSIRKAVTKGIIPKQRASRHISRLTKALNRVSAS